jgi:hypothetical protein
MWATKMPILGMRFAAQGQHQLTLAATFAGLDNATSPTFSFQFAHPMVKTYGTKIRAGFAHGRALSGVNLEVGDGSQTSRDLPTVK